eukprot:1159890-Pelagomonas_calceolata.AAC.11
MEAATDQIIQASPQAGQAQDILHAYHKFFTTLAKYYLCGCHMPSNIMPKLLAKDIIPFNITYLHLTDAVIDSTRI